MSQEKKSMIRHIGTKLMAATLLVTALVFIWSTTQHRYDPSGLSQDTWVDQTGHLHVLGIELERSTLRETEIALKSRSDIALYIYPKEHPKPGLRLEAYFPSIADHSKVILELEADPALLEKLQKRATLPHLYPNEVARMNLHPEDIPVVQQQRVRKLTLIPSIQITDEMLRKRFGPPSTISADSEKISHYYYHAIGLHAILTAEDSTQLEFSNPAQVD